MASQPPPSISVSAASESLGRGHVHRRVFIGPMPEKVISQTEAHLKKNGRRLFNLSTDEGDIGLSQMIKQNAFNFFIREGGRVEDWGEREEQNITEEMFQRWRYSEWHLRNRKKNPPSRQASRWVGGSFEIGRFLGMDILQETESIRDKISSYRERTSLDNRSARKTSFSGSYSTHATLHALLSSTAQDTFVTPLTSPLNAGVRTPEISVFGSAGDSIPASSSTSLLRLASKQPGLEGPDRVKAHTEVVPRPIIKAPSLSALSDGVIPIEQKGKRKLVHYADPLPQESGPAPPSEVLERTGIDVEDTSAGASVLPEPMLSVSDLDWGSVVMRDRMLVRSYYTKSSVISPLFDETQNRTMRDLQDADWGEYMVVWRKDRIEVYKDYRMPGKEWMAGHKKLAFVIPLKSSKTQLSLYSFVDLTFCITCTPTRPHRDPSKSRWFFHREKEGVNIFIFKVKSRSRAYDWTWQLWRELGGELPQTIEVRNPRLDTKVKIDIPVADGDRIYQIFSRENIIALCATSLRLVPDWKNLIEREIMGNKSLELVWRADTTLDWIWLDENVEGEPIRWAVLSGLALKQSTQPPVLEIRIAEHYPTYVSLKNGSHLNEPPAIEGYLERVKPNTQAKQSLYITTHDGNLFILPHNRSYPPSPPTLQPDVADIESYATTLRRTEVDRGAMQIMNSTGVTDLRTILLIRRAFHLIPQSTHNESRKAQEDDILFGIWSQPEQRTQSDEEDEGGEEGLGKSEDKPRLRMQRSFELLLTTGSVIRFEAHSCRVAVEWVERLRALVLYWKQRHRIDAKEEMDLAQARRARLTPLTRAIHDDRECPPEAPADVSAPLPALKSLYNWCVLEGCRPIIKGGKIYVRRGLYGQYKLVQLFLIAGHLGQFRVNPNSSLHTAVHKKINLVDAYVCSGYLAALALPKGQYSANANVAPRRYQDGLETDDPEEDMLFMVWYRPQPSTMNQTSMLSSPSKTIPALSAKRKVLVFRTRSKLERDSWCWALNCEIEKLVRTQKEREERLRDTGSLIPL